MDALPGGELFAVSVQREPRGGSLRYASVEYPGIDVFNQVHVLNPKSVTGSHNGTGVSALVYIFQNQTESSRSVLEHIIEFLLALLAQKGEKSLVARVEHALKIKGPEQITRGLSVC